MDNFIIEFKHALSAEYCDTLIQQFEQDDNKAPGRTGAGVDPAKKQSVDLMISELAPWQQHCGQINQIILQAMVEYTRRYPFLVTGAVSPAISNAATGQTHSLTPEDIGTLDNGQLARLISSIYRHDNINFQRYTKARDGYHHWHSEHYPHPDDPSQRSLHRVLLWLIYLNDVEQGGETEFFYQQAKVKPTKGSLILAPCTFTHTHRGQVPLSGDKYVLASWLLYHPAAQLYGQDPSATAR
jgi:hypothetical protein